MMIDKLVLPVNKTQPVNQKRMSTKGCVSMCMSPYADDIKHYNVQLCCTTPSDLHLKFVSEH